MGDASEAVDLLKWRQVNSHSWALHQDGRVFRSIENYTADGHVDFSRSHYSIHGRSVTRRQFRAEQRRPA